MGAVGREYSALGGHRGPADRADLGVPVSIFLREFGVADDLEIYRRGGLPAV